MIKLEYVLLVVMYVLMSSYQKTFNTFEWIFGEGTILFIIIGFVCVAIRPMLNYLDGKK